IWEFGNGKSKTVDYSSMTYKYDTGGTYQVKLTTVTASGCSNSYKTDVTVFNKPNSLFSADDFCFGKTLALNDLSTTPVGSILQRRWTTGDGKSYVTKTVNHNYDKPGKYKLQLVTANTLGCTDTMTQIIVVAAQPIPKIAADKACVGTVLNIRDLSDLGKNDEWLPNKWFKDGAKIDSGNMVSTVTINQTTTLKLVVETKAGCTDSTQVTLDPLFPVKPDFSLGSGCEGDTVNILDNFNRAELDSIIWIGLGVEVIKTDTTYKAIFKENNRHQLFARTIAQNGCKDSAVYNQFSVYNTPKGGFSYILDSATKSVKFKAIDTTANTYEWNFDNGQPATITAADSTTNTFNINGVYNVKLTAKTSNGCAMATDSVISIFFSNSVKNIGENLVSVYPNPTTDFIQIKLDYNNQLINWQLRSLNGKLIKSGVNPNITLKSVAKGNYLLITQTQKGTFTTQVNKL
ncbi:MAG: PKD domain-containing protein, partial [Bacteroidia bacterium]